MTKMELNILRRALEKKHAELDNFRQEREPSIDVIDRNYRLLREIRAALSRIAAGTFGICLGCEGEIGLKRLSRVPWAASCVDCHEANDHKALEPGARARCSWFTEAPYRNAGVEQIWSTDGTSDRTIAFKNS